MCVCHLCPAPRLSLRSNNPEAGQIPFLEDDVETEVIFASVLEGGTMTLTNKMEMKQSYNLNAKNNWKNNQTKKTNTTNDTGPRKFDKVPHF